MTKVFGSKVQSEKFSGKRGVLALCKRKEKKYLSYVTALGMS